MKNEVIGDRKIEDIKRGYILEGEKIICLFCGEEYENGVVYQESNRFYTAEKYMNMHINKIHDSVFSTMIALDKKMTGLSEHQSKLLKLFYIGATDNEIQFEMKIGSSSTVRNHRLLLKEKERQAKLFIAMMELLREKNENETNIVKEVKPHSTAKMVDKRYELNSTEESEILSKYFKKGLNGPLSTFQMKEKSKIVVLRHISDKFDKSRKYSEKEVNEILKNIHSDYAHLRRYLIEYGFLDRKRDGSEYWIKADERAELKKELETDSETATKNVTKTATKTVTKTDTKTDSETATKTVAKIDTKTILKNNKETKIDINEEARIKTENKTKKDETSMKTDRKKELLLEYKDKKTESCIFEIKHKDTGAHFVFSTPNIKTINGRIMELNAGGHKNKKLQEMWSEFGESAFEINHLEVFVIEDEDATSMKKILKEKEAKYII